MEKPLTQTKPQAPDEESDFAEKDNLALVILAILTLGLIASFFLF